MQMCAYLLEQKLWKIYAISISLKDLQGVGVVPW